MLRLYHMEPKMSPRHSPAKRESGWGEMAAAGIATLVVLFVLSAVSAGAAMVLGAAVFLALVVRIGFLIRKEL